MAKVKVNYDTQVQLNISPEEAYLIYTLTGGLTGSFDGPRKYSDNIYNLLTSIFKEGETASSCLNKHPNFKDCCLDEFLGKMRGATNVKR